MEDENRDARRRMIEVAERLVAEEGLGSVSLRRVGQEAGQRNNSAAQYHFGSRQGLVDAIVQLRSAQIDARRAELLTALDEELGGRPADVRALVRVLVHPLVESAAGEPRRTHYLRFLANATDHYSLRGSWQVGEFHPPTYQLVVQRLRATLPGVPEATFDRRVRWVSRVSLRLLADHELTLVQDDDGLVAGTTARVLADVVDMLVALVAAPDDSGDGAGDRD
ncbi:TetR family transcriptional regulator [Nocardioides sp. IC4_145]|uniref:TetR family transcriptional regulator n=1 Tax=Nocardioides sp. IC4_145 TaxID=2714037 RepID=UPI00140C20F6|nr:TetR family transcriptional regulator [Nocardioides sp. IC4_145]